ncbi:hypothetical protein [Gemmatimonas aurantiaca]|uniref:hypothetical protein n=1 Tax=Gemmatimonas aurantiaca TaxID=173480 RepID=UPI00301CFF68
MEALESNIDHGFHSLSRVPHPPAGPSEDEAEYCAVRSYRDFYDAREGFCVPQVNHEGERTTTLSPGLYPSLNDAIGHSHISMRLVRHPTQSHRICRIGIKNRTRIRLGRKPQPQSVGFDWIVFQAFQELLSTFVNRRHL